MRSALLEFCTFVFVMLPGAAGLASTLNAPQATQSGLILSRRVASFKGEGLCLVDALLKLGQQEQVPLGIEYVSREALKRPIGKDVGETTVGELIKLLLVEDKLYRWHVRGSVLNISHESVAFSKVNLLDRVLPDFAIPRCSLEEASNVLYMDLDRQLHPEVTSYAGEYSPGDLQNLVGPLELRNAPVRDILNRLVSSASKKAAWIVRVPPGHLGQLPTQGFWTIVEYQTPPRSYAGELWRMVFGR